MIENYETAIARAALLRTRSQARGLVLEAFLSAYPKGPMGLTPDAVKAMPEYQALKDASDKAVAQEAQFNGWYLKQFAAEHRKDRRERGDGWNNEIRLDGETVLKGRTVSRADYNNLLGIDFTDDADYQSHLDDVRQVLGKALEPGCTVEFLTEGNLVAHGTLGDQQCVRVTASMEKAQSVRAEWMTGLKTGDQVEVPYSSVREDIHLMTVATHDDKWLLLSPPGSTGIIKACARTGMTQHGGARIVPPGFTPEMTAVAVSCGRVAREALRFA